MRSHALEGLEVRRLFAGADLDPTFGVDGLKNESFPNDTALMLGMGVQSDGKVVVSGVLNIASEDRLVRYLADGSLDSAFHPAITGSRRLLPTRDGKLIVDVANGVARLNNDGSLDTTFGGAARGSKSGTPAGRSVPSFAGDFSVEDIDVMPDGRIVMLGHEGTSENALINNALVLLNADGSPAGSFGSGGDGIVEAPFHPDADTFDDWTQVAFSPDGKVVISVAGDRLVNGNDSSGTSFVGLRRFNADGTADSTFTENLKYSWDRTVNGVFGQLFDLDVASDGSPIAVGNVATAASGTIEAVNGALLMRATPTGDADTAFDGDGILIDTYGFHEFTTLNAVKTLGDGRFYAAGGVARNNQTTLVVTRYNADGTLDTSFGGNARAGGVLRIPELKLSGNGPHLALTPDGGVVIADDARASETDANRVWNTRRLQGDPTIRVNSKGSLLINGTTDADDVSVTLRASDGRLVARVNDYVRSFPPAKVKRFAAFTYGGNDTFTIGDNVRGGYGEGGDGNDSLNGGQDGDVLLGGSGIDRIFGNDGDDILLGGGGRDYLLGGAGKDDLFGNAGIDTLSGAGGNDRLFGGHDADKIFGGSGNDSADADAKDSFDSVETLLT